MTSLDEVSRFSRHTEQMTPAVRAHFFALMRALLDGSEIADLQIIALGNEHLSEAGRRPTVTAEIQESEDV